MLKNETEQHQYTSPCINNRLNDFIGIFKRLLLGLNGLKYEEDPKYHELIQILRQSINGSTIDWVMDWS